MYEDNMLPIVLIGNKSDLANKRQVKYTEGKKLAETWGNSAFLETSAKNGENVEKAFATLVREIRAQQQPKQQQKPQKKRWCSIL